APAGPRPVPVPGKPFGEACRLPPGTIVGDFVVENWVAQGGCGEVYRARQRRPQRFVALKVLVELGPENRTRFEREAQILAELDHPAIAKTFSCGTLEGEPSLPWIAMEWI